MTAPANHSATCRPPWPGWRSLELLTARASHRIFAAVLDTAGDVSDQTLQDFLAHGYTTQNALEVVLGIGTYTMSTLANRLTGAPVDDQLAAFA